ncbi:MAG: serine hydrolase domain-containing protein [Phycisphaerales bacterium]
MHRLHATAHTVVALMLTTAAVLIPTRAALAQTPNQAQPQAQPAPLDISDILRKIAQDHPRVPALAAVVIEGDRITMEGVTGVRAAGSPERATLDDQWHLGSCTKAMTATLAAMLVEQGALSWDSNPVQSFPDLAKGADESWKEATLLRLITNRAGAPADLAPRGLWGRLWNSNETPANLRRMLLEGVMSRATEFPPGTDYKYSNTNFAIAGMLIERAAQQPWESVIEHRLFAPLNITSAGFGAPGLQGVISQPRGHTPDGKPVQPGHDADNPQAIAPAGTAHMSIRDWAKFVSLHLRGDAANPHRSCRLLTPASFDTLHTAPDAHEYAGGWGLATRDWAGGEGPRKGRVLTHAGSNTSWFCVAWLAPARDFAVLVCTNIAGEDGPAAADAAAAALIQKESELHPPASR